MRLWLNSTGVLEALINRRMLTRSASFIEDARRAAQIYVPNRSYDRAIEILNQRHVCIVCGIPGIGKTTLARVLALAHAAQGYEVYEISEDIEEVNAVWNEGTRQFFYYDDFLGQTAFGDKLNKNEDARMASILQRVARSSSKRIILTTREYILEQAKHRYEKISRYNFNLDSYTIDARSDYTFEVKARVLYNQIYHSELPQADKELFVSARAYMPIVAHRNFNPRLLEDALQICAAEREQTDSTPLRLLKTLDEPQSLWAHVVNNQLDDTCIHLLLVLFSLRSHVKIEDLWRAYESFCRHVGGECSERLFKRSLKTLEQTMLAITQNEGDTEVGFHNPSVVDYMKIFLREHPKFMETLLCSAVYFEQVDLLCTVIRERQLSSLADTVGFRANISEALRRTHLTEGCARENTLFGLMRITDVTYRMARLLEIAEQLSIKNLNGYISGFLRRNSVMSHSRHEHVQVRLINALWDSTLPGVRSLRRELTESYATKLVDDIHDWDSAKRVQDFYDGLSEEMISNDLREMVQDALDGYADEVFQDVADGRPLGHWGTFDDVEEMITYAEGRKREFPYLSITKSIVADIINNPSSSRDDRPTLFSWNENEESPTSDDLNIMGMFRSLKKDL
ncbi:hypothetical protein HerbRD11066_57060 [Herbidospora sp. RD11066]